MVKVTTTTKDKEFRSAPRNLSQEESDVVSSYAMLAMVEIVGESSVLRIETKITTRNMQIETGVIILTISSPKVSRTVDEDEGLRISAMVVKREFRSKAESVLILLWQSWMLVSSATPFSGNGPGLNITYGVCYLHHV